MSVSQAIVLVQWIFKQGIVWHNHTPSPVLVWLMSKLFCVICHILWLLYPLHIKLPPLQKAVCPLQRRKEKFCLENSALLRGLIWRKETDISMQQPTAKNVYTSEEYGALKHHLPYIKANKPPSPTKTSAIAKCSAHCTKNKLIPKTQKKTHKKWIQRYEKNFNLRASTTAISLQRHRRNDINSLNTTRSNVQKT